jgi:Co/Zn/Cd efflux system component
VLWIVLAINAAMFLVEIGAGVVAGSASLQADALDFLADAGNYAISLLVLGLALRYRAMAALAKGLTMGVFGTGTGWPDLIFAAIMASLALQGAWLVLRQARGELQSPTGRIAVQSSN